MRHLLLSLLSTFCAVAAAQTVTWPTLPTEGFIAGRAATKSDVESGQAVFVAAQGEVAIGKPMPIKIPQYAWSMASAKKQPVIVIQAEEANGMKLIGARLLTGGYVAGLASDFELLGTNVPK